MAIVAVTTDVTRLDNLDSNGNASNIGGGSGTAIEPDFVFQGTGSVSRKISSSTGAGFYITTPSTIDMTAAGNEVWMAKVIVTNKDALNSTGMRVRIGSATSAYYEYLIADDGTSGNADYPLKGGWLIVPIDPNIAGYRTATTGSPALTAADYFGITGAFSSTSKGENVAMDAIDVGSGLFLVGGDGADTDGVYDDFTSFDQGDGTNGRQGFVTTSEGILFCFGTLNIGRNSALTSTATGFTDSAQTLVFPDGRFAAGWAGLYFDIGQATTIISNTSNSYLGRGDTTTTDTRPVLNVVGTSGSYTSSSESFVNFAEVVLTSSCTVTSGNFQDLGSLTLSGATVSGTTFSAPQVSSGVALISGDDISNLSDSRFVSSGTGHAIEITTAGTYDFNGLTFEGYGSGGDSAIYNNSAGAVTINVTGGGTTPTVNNGIGASTTVVSSVLVTLTGLQTSTEIRVFEAGTQTEVVGTGVESTAGSTHSFTLSSGQAVDISVLALGFINFRILNYSTSLDASVPIQQQLDRQYENP